MMVNGKQIFACLRFQIYLTEPSGKKLEVLSGGNVPRSSRHTLKPRRQCFVLDEPTNDIDVTRLRALEEALEILQDAPYIFTTVGS